MSSPEVSSHCRAQSSSSVAPAAVQACSRSARRGIAVAVSGEMLAQAIRGTPGHRGGRPADAARRRAWRRRRRRSRPARRPRSWRRCRPPDGWTGAGRPRSPVLAGDAELGPDQLAGVPGIPARPGSRNSANGSFSHRWSHSSGSPGRRTMCGISWAIVVARFTRSPAVAAARKTYWSRRVTQPGFSIAPALKSGTNTVVLVPRVADAEQLVEGVEGCPGDREQVLGLGGEMFGQRCPGVQTERNAVVLGGDRAVQAGDQCTK